MNPEERKKRQKLAYKKWATSHPEKVHENHVKWKITNPERYHENNITRSRSFRSKNPLHYKLWAENNKEQIKKRHTRYMRERAQTDIDFKLVVNLRSRLRLIVKGKDKVGSAIVFLGCTASELKFYLEGQFSDGMTWDNYGRRGWHIDHKVPLSFFDLSDERQLEEACHYTNLQPLWAVENLKKGAKVYLYEQK